MPVALARHVGPQPTPEIPGLRRSDLPERRFGPTSIPGNYGSKAGETSAHS